MRFEATQKLAIRKPHCPDIHWLALVMVRCSRSTSLIEFLKQRKLPKLSPFTPDLSVTIFPFPGARVNGSCRHIQVKAQSDTVITSNGLPIVRNHFFEFRGELEHRAE
jgi:hypothetical protein